MCLNSVKLTWEYNTVKVTVVQSDSVEGNLGMEAALHWEDGSETNSQTHVVVVKRGLHYDLGALCLQNQYCTPITKIHSLLY